MTLHAAVIKEQGVTFAVVVVKKWVVDSPHESTKAINFYSPRFGNIPVALMGQDSRGRAHYRGAQNIVDFLSHLHISQIPWKEYRIS